MDQNKPQSELAQRMQQIDEQNAAGRLGLYGPAVVATHASNTVRMQRGAERILGLIRAGKHEEAETLMSTDYWSVDEQRGQASQPKQNEVAGDEKWHE